MLSLLLEALLLCLFVTPNAPHLFAVNFPCRDLYVCIYFLLAALAFVTLTISSAQVTPISRCEGARAFFFYSKHLLSDFSSVPWMLELSSLFDILSVLIAYSIWNGCPFLVKLYAWHSGFDSFVTRKFNATDGCVYVVFFLTVLTGLLGRSAWWWLARSPFVFASCFRMLQYERFLLFPFCWIAKRDILMFLEMGSDDKEIHTIVISKYCIRVHNTKHTIFLHSYFVA